MKTTSILEYKLFDNEFIKQDKTFHYVTKTTLSEVFPFWFKGNVYEFIYIDGCFYPYIKICGEKRKEIFLNYFYCKQLFENSIKFNPLNDENAFEENRKKIEQIPDYKVYPKNFSQY